MTYNKHGKHDLIESKRMDGFCLKRLFPIRHNGRQYFIGFVVGLFCIQASANGPTNRTTGGVIASGPSNSAAQGKAASGSQGGAQMQSIMMAALMASMCTPKNPVPCVLAALAAAQAASLGGTKEGAMDNATQLSAGVGGSTPQETTPRPSATETSVAGVRATQEGVLKSLAEKGVKVSDDWKTITMPGDKKVPINSGTSSDSGLKDAGFSDQQIAAGKSALADAGSKLASTEKSKSIDVAADVGGGGGGGGGMASATGGGGTLPRSNVSLSGLSKNFGSSKIGVQADNIFEMITRRYKEKDKTNTFIKN